MRSTDVNQRREHKRDWKEDYKRKSVSADEAAKGGQVRRQGCFTFCASHSGALALGKRKDELKNVYLEINAPWLDPCWLQPGCEENFFVGAINFLGPVGRPSHDAKVCSFIPCLMSLRAKLCDEERLHGRRRYRRFHDQRFAS